MLGFAYPGTPRRAGRRAPGPLDSRAGAVAGGKCPEAQRIQPDEAGGVLLVVGATVVLEGDQGVRIKGLRASAAGDDDVALVKLEPDGAFDMLLALVDQALQHAALGREPEAVIDQLGVA